MKTGRSSVKSAILVLASLCAMPACSGVDDTFLEDDLGEDQDEIGELTLALNSDTNCGTASADKTYTTIISPTFTSPRSYAAGRNGCENAYFVRVNEYLMGIDSDTVHYFAYAEEEPSTAAACRDTRLMVYAFERKANGTAVFVDSASRRGEAFVGADGDYYGCDLPWFSPEGLRTDLPSPFSLTRGRNYQFAVSARTNNSGKPVMQRIRLSNTYR